MSTKGQGCQQTDRKQRTIRETATESGPSVTTERHLPDLTPQLIIAFN